MIIPPLKTTIDRRLLLNYRVDPAVLQPYLHGDNIQLRLINGKAIAGICLIRLTNLRPALIPTHIGLHAENAAHRFGIQHTNPDGTTNTGVYIPERHTTSWLAKIAGGRVFPGLHHHANFNIEEQGGTYHITMHATGNTIDVHAHKTNQWDSKTFPTPQDASNFFKDSPIGYSPNKHNQLDAIELITPHWETHPLKVDSVHATFYDNLPEGSVEFDDALIMEHIQSEWRKPATT